jgi:hypothetical protein
MAGITSKSFSSPDETRTPPNTTVEVVRLGDASAARITFQPGWRWSRDMASVVGTDSCQVRHVGSVLQGTIHVVHEDGSEGEARGGDAYVIEPGHDAWVVGDDVVVLLEFESAERYARPA